MSEAKAEHELTVFSKFASKAGLPVEADSIRSEYPPQPDISCRIAGVPYLFELTRMVHSDVADSIGRHLAKIERSANPSALESFWYDDRLALQEAIERKLSKRHETGAARIALLVYIDGVFHPPGMFSEWALEVIDKSAPSGPWQEVWVYDAHRGSVLARWVRDGQNDGNV